MVGCNFSLLCSVCLETRPVPQFGALLATWQDMVAVTVLHGEALCRTHLAERPKSVE